MTKDKSGMGKRIRSCRVDKELSQSALAKLADVSTTHLSAVEKGIVGLSNDALARVSIILEESFDYLKYGDEKARERNYKRLQAKNAPVNTQIEGQLNIFDIYGF